MLSSGPTTSARCPSSWSARGFSRWLRSKSKRPSTCSRLIYRRSDSRPMRRGCRSAWGATTRAPSASFRPYAARRRIDGRARSGGDRSARGRWGRRDHAAGAKRQRVRRRVRRPWRLCGPVAACGDIDGLERVRFTSPHPRDFTDDVIDAMATTHNVMPALHMPLQSGSDRILQSMRRPTAVIATCESSTRSATDCPMQPSRRTSSSAFPVRPKKTFGDDGCRTTARFASAFTFRYCSDPEPLQPRCLSRRIPMWCRSATPVGGTGQRDRLAREQVFGG